MLNQNDMIKNATVKQYTQIAELSGIDVDFFVESSVIRGGCFWSHRYKIPIPGVLSVGNLIPVNKFIENLKVIKCEN
jgi:hypothetical protein